MVSDSCFRNTEGTPRMCPNKSAPCGGNRLVTASDAPKRKYNIPHAKKVHSAQNLNPKEECEAAGQHTPKSQNILEHTHHSSQIRDVTYYTAKYNTSIKRLFRGAKIKNAKFF